MVFARYRRYVFADARLKRFEGIMVDVCADFEAELRRANGEHDHAHLSVHRSPKLVISELVNSLEGVSARLLCKEHDSRARRYL
ncbi:hypothetical protein GCM10020216_046500 [Nonomuraea helvata]